MNTPGGIYLLVAISATAFALFVNELGAFLRESDENRLERIMAKRAIISGDDLSGLKVEVGDYFKNVKTKLYSMLVFWEVSILSAFLLVVLLKESKLFVAYVAKNHSVLASDITIGGFLLTAFLLFTLPFGFVHYLIKMADQFQAERLEQLI